MYVASLVRPIQLSAIVIVRAFVPNITFCSLSGPVASIVFGG